MTPHRNAKTPVGAGASRETSEIKQTGRKLSEITARSSSRRENFLSTPAEPQKLAVTLRRVEGNRSAYRRLVLDRYAAGLLDPFLCSACHNWALDPMGRHGKREWLCHACYDKAGEQRS
jgi:hypothetical protein